jgi:hypothetical protein
LPGVKTKVREGEPTQSGSGIHVIGGFGGGGLTACRGLGHLPIAAPEIGSRWCRV